MPVAEHVLADAELERRASAVRCELLAPQRHRAAREAPMHPDDHQRAADDALAPRPMISMSNGSLSLSSTKPRPNSNLPPGVVPAPGRDPMSAFCARLGLGRVRR